MPMPLVNWWNRVTSRTMLGLWAVVMTLLVVLFGAHALMLSMARPVERLDCTESTPAMVRAYWTANEIGGGRRLVERGCSITVGNTAPAVSFDDASDLITITSGRLTASDAASPLGVDGYVPVAMVSRMQELQLPPALAALEALTPWANLPDEPADAAPIATVRAIDQPGDLRFHVPGAQLDQRTFVQVVWKTPADAKALIERDATR